MNTIDPINPQIEREPEASFSNKEAQAKTEQVYPAPSRDTRFLEEAIIEQTNVIKKIKKQIIWIIVLLIIPYILSLLFFAFGMALTNSINKSLNGSTNYQNSLRR